LSELDVPKTSLIFLFAWNFLFPLIGAISIRHLDEETMNAVEELLRYQTVSTLNHELQQITILKTIQIF
jgi:hypothetical protein